MRFTRPGAKARLRSGATFDRRAQLRGGLLGEGVGDEGAGAQLGAREELELVGAAQRRVELDVQVALALRCAGLVRGDRGSLMDGHDVREGALEQRVVAARERLQSGCEQA